ncbi:pyridoxal-phosphate dependent enzyme [Cupriavidus basilensis]
MIIVESSSGNTGIGLALAAIEFGLRFIAVVDHHAAPDKIAVMRALGAEIRYVQGDFEENEVAVVERYSAWPRRSRRRFREPYS